MIRYFHSCYLADPNSASAQPGNKQPQQQQQQQKQQKVTPPVEEGTQTGKTENKDPEITGEVPTEQEPKEIEKIPSFDEWKQKMLAEQAEQEKSKQLEGTFWYRLWFILHGEISSESQLYLFMCTAGVLKVIFVIIIIGVQFM